MRARLTMVLSLIAAASCANVAQSPRPEIRDPDSAPICGDPAIRGTRIPVIEAKLPGCGLSSGVSVTSVSGVVLSQPARIDCDTATALNTWVDQSVAPAIGRRGGGVSSLQVVAHYACRTRNNLPGARVSEHGRGKAIDIAGFRLRNGEVISVLTGWNTRRDRPVLKKMHQGACGPFGTVLGPDADRFHRDHFHFDTADYRSGSYCR